MRLTATPITNYQNTNAFITGSEWTIRAGDPNTLYFQLIDLDSSKLRHMTGVGSSNQPVVVTATFPSIDDTQVITVSCTVDPNDSSIFSIPLTSSQSPASGNVQFSVSEGGVARKFSVQNMIAVEQLNMGCC